MSAIGASMVQPSFADPALHEWHRQMRDHHPVFFDETIRMWKVFRYDDVVRVLSDHATFSSELYRIMPGGGGGASLTMTDPPRHRQLRTLVSKAFTPAMVARLKPRIAAITTELIDQVADRGAMDLVEDLAYPLPVMVIAELLGVPPADRALFRRCAHGLLSLGSGDLHDESLANAVAAVLKELLDYLRDQVLDRRDKSRDDLLSRLVHAEVDGQRLDTEEVVNFANLLLMAGHATTTLVLANVILTLDEHPAAMAALRADLGLLPGTIEEVMRYRPVLTISGRLTTREVELGGQTIPANQMVYTSTMSANRDERRFPDPDRFDIHREQNPHLGFGHGIHYCLGAPLGRLELETAMRLILGRFTHICRDPAAPPQFYETLGVFGLKTLPVVFSRA